LWEKKGELCGRKKPASWEKMRENAYFYGLKSADEVLQILAHKLITDFIYYTEHIFL
jgi:hypothetical protein